MLNILELSTISDWAAIVTLLLTIGGIYANKKATKIEILKQLHSFKRKLKYEQQVDTEENVESIRDEMLDLLYKTKATMMFSSSFNPFKLEEEIFSMACQKYVNHKEGVTLKDVTFSTIGLVDRLIQFLKEKM